ncbi:hypothetical protein BUQ74_17290 [Leptospira weilii serovar Heyan]|nr:hypothetical protein LEP1GSC086_3089 [Leptospira weilii str. LNT 1234]OMI16105.1 hypothetical protein BUQ74_17290 [Leptospira weilii serovar Heyan]
MKNLRFSILKILKCKGTHSDYVFSIDCKFRPVNVDGVLLFSFHCKLFGRKIRSKLSFRRIETGSIVFTKTKRNFLRKILLFPK